MPAKTDGRGSIARTGAAATRPQLLSPFCGGSAQRGTCLAARGTCLAAIALACVPFALFAIRRNLLTLPPLYQVKQKGTMRFRAYDQ
jgi:hypothetical protein